MTPQTWRNRDFPALDLVRTSRLVRFAGRITLIILIGCTLCLLCLPWQQTAPGTGVVLALNPQLRPQIVRSNAEGIVLYVKEGLREGSYVEKGQVLIEMQPLAIDGMSELDRQLETIRQKETLIVSRIEFVKQQRKLQNTSGQFMFEALKRELEAEERKLEQTQKEVAKLEAELLDKETQRSIAEDIIQQGIISRQVLVSKQQAEKSKQQAVLKAKDAEREALAKFESKKEAIQSKQGEIEIKNRDAENKLLEEEVKLQTILKEKSELLVKRQEMDRLKISAPRSGRIQQWFGLEGSDNVKKSDPLFAIVPEADELAVELKINGNDMPLVHVGDRVRLQFEGWPAVQFVGWPSVAIGTFGGKVNSVYPTDDGKGNFRILVTADVHFEREKSGWPDEDYLRQGVQANGWVLLRQVPLGYEVWRQLNGFPASLPEGTAEEKKAAKPKLPKL